MGFKFIRSRSTKSARSRIKPADSKATAAADKTVDNKVENKVELRDEQQNGAVRQDTEREGVEDDLAAIMMPLLKCLCVDAPTGACLGGPGGTEVVSEEKGDDIVQAPVQHPSQTTAAVTKTDKKSNKVAKKEAKRQLQLVRRRRRL